MIRALLFDWGNTIMVDFRLPGPMSGWEKVAWVEGAEQAIRELSKQFHCYVATNADQSDSAAVLAGLKRVGADQYFSGIFTSKDLGYEKPDARFFMGILKLLEIPATEVVMIGDNYEKDITGAANCMIKTVFFNRDKAPGDFPLAGKVIHVMHELPETIRNL
jgi:putative hydrolase of the HAD superfamily